MPFWSECDDYIVDRAAVMALQRQLSLVSSDKDDTDMIENASSTVAVDTTPSSNRLRRRTATSPTGSKSADDKSSATEKNPLMSNQLIKDEDAVEGTVCKFLLVHLLWSTVS